MNNAQQVEQQAANWLARRDGSDWSVEDQEALDRWLDEGYGNKAAYWRLEEGWRRADRVAALGLMPQRRNAIGGRFRSHWKPLAMAASLALVVALGATQLDLAPGAEAPHGQQIATVVGGHKVVPLDDGSSIELNTATLVRAAVSPERREVWLEKGEAYFDVRHSQTVPFVVHAGPKTVTVLGTKFSVRRDEEKVTVAVLEGRVRVTEASAADATTTLIPAGSIAVTEPKATLVTESEPGTVQAQMAWRDGQLIFRSDLLADAAAEFNRYNERKLVVSGQAANLKISGSFRATNVDGFARLLRDAYGLNVTVNDAGVRVTD